MSNHQVPVKPVGSKLIVHPLPKKEEELFGFDFPVLDTSVEKKTKVSMIYKIIFFYHVDFAKDILAYGSEEL